MQICKIVTGVWGPYWSAVLPDLWLLEGGQSAAGKLVDHVIDRHPARAEAQRRASASGEGLAVHQVLEDVLEEMRTDSVTGNY